jgi:hypothetical protein
LLFPATAGQGFFQKWIHVAQINPDLLFVMIGDLKTCRTDREFEGEGTPFGGAVQSPSMEGPRIQVALGRSEVTESRRRSNSCFMADQRPLGYQNGRQAR